MSNVLETQENTQPQPMDVDEAADALLKRWEDAEEPSEQATEEATELNQEADDLEQEELEEDQTDEEAETDPDEEVDEDDSDEDEEEIEEVELTDDTLIEISIDGATKQASIKELKRLYGQEASLTRKSQEVADQRKKAEDNIGKTDAVLTQMLERAEARYKPYSEVDMLLASKNMNDADFAQLRKEAQDAHDDLKFVQEQSDDFYKQLKTQQQEQMQEAAKEAVKVLEQDIPDWNNQLYDDIRSYAIGQGLVAEEVNNIVSPDVIKIINKARLFDQAKKVTTTKKKRVVKKVLKSNKAPATAAQTKNKRVKDAEARMLAGNANDLDDIADVLLSRWEA